MIETESQGASGSHFDMPSLRTNLELAIQILDPALRQQLGQLLIMAADDEPVALPDAFDLPWIVPAVRLSDVIPLVILNDEEVQAQGLDAPTLSEKGWFFVASAVRQHLLHDWFWQEVKYWLDHEFTSEPPH